VCASGFELGPEATITLFGNEFCPDHPGVKKVCPRCFSAKGGTATARTHSRKQLRMDN